LNLAFNAHGEGSHAYVQIGAETCAYLQFDMRAMFAVSYIPQTVPNAAQVRTDFQRELARELPRHSIADIQTYLPNADPDKLGSKEEVSPQNMSVYGYVADGVLFSSDCPTRFGPDPFCRTKPLPSYSLAKSLVAGIGLMRLERLYPGAASVKIADYVPQCAREHWGDVSFEQVLDMTSGNYTSAIYDQDESSDRSWAFLLDETHAGRLAKACSMHSRQAEPGTRWVYHTSDTYILGTAMQAFLRQRSADPDADFYRQLLVPMWQELGLSPLLMNTRRSYDTEQQPFTGWGLTLHADDLAKIALFLQKEGKIDQKSWLDERMIQAALQRNPDDPGHRAINESLRYRAGFWAYNAGPALGCSGAKWIPSMSGFGGLIIALMPNGHVYLYVSDGHEYVWKQAAIASDQIKPFCEKMP
jgi:hypothetical protein